MWVNSLNSTFWVLRSSFFPLKILYCSVFRDTVLVYLSLTFPSCGHFLNTGFLRMLFLLFYTGFWTIGLLTAWTGSFFAAWGSPVYHRMFSISSRPRSYKSKTVPQL